MFTVYHFISQVNKILVYFRQNLRIIVLFKVFRTLSIIILAIKQNYLLTTINNDALVPPFMKEYKNPTPTVDVLLERDSKILMVRRKKDPYKDHLALPGGFVNEGETVEDAMKRETMEEISLEVHPIDILGVYSDPRRDPRKHIMTVVFVGIIVGGEIRANDDAASIEWIQLHNIDQLQQQKLLAFDHAQILRDYRQWKSSSGTFWSTKRRND
jgi:8-oxo-dGTP diphosphatase